MLKLGLPWRACDAPKLNISDVMSERSTDSGNDGRVVRFRPRGGAPGGLRWPLIGPQADWQGHDLAKFERPETEEDYRHRMKMNLLGLVVTIVLMGVGAWLATTLAEIQKNQDCYLQGRRNCVPIPQGTPSGIRFSEKIMLEQDARPRS
jgi:hypothetical protein